MVLLALGVTFFFEGAAEPGDLQRSIGTTLAGLTLMLALYAAEVAPRWLRVAAASTAAIVVAVIAASVADEGSTGPATTSSWTVARRRSWRTCPPRSP